MALLLLLQPELRCKIRRDTVVVALPGGDFGAEVGEGLFLGSSRSDGY